MIEIVINTTSASNFQIVVLNKSHISYLFLSLLKLLLHFIFISTHPNNL